MKYLFIINLFPNSKVSGSLPTISSSIIRGKSNPASIEALQSKVVALDPNRVELVKADFNKIDCRLSDAAIFLRALSAVSDSVLKV